MGGNKLGLLYSLVSRKRKTKATAIIHHPNTLKTQRTKQANRQNFAETKAVCFMFEFFQTV